jgi:hypothetical protein
VVHLEFDDGLEEDGKISGSIFRTKRSRSPNSRLISKLPLRTSLWLNGRWPAEATSSIHTITSLANQKPVSVTLDALDWLERKLAVKGNFRRIEERPSLLSALLHPCFERLIELSGREGSRFWFEQREVHLKHTRPVRRKALEIVRQVLSAGSWRAALAGISALENAIRRVAPPEISWSEDGEAMRERWRPERFEGLEVLRFALKRHDHFLVRYAVRALLRRDIAFEEDSPFERAARSLGGNVLSGDLRSKTAPEADKEWIDLHDSELKADWALPGRLSRLGNDARQRRAVQGTSFFATTGDWIVYFCAYTIKLCFMSGMKRSAGKTSPCMVSIFRLSIV